MCLLRLSLGVTIAAFLAGCSGNVPSSGSFVPNTETQAPTVHRRAPNAAIKPNQGSISGYVYVSNVTANGTSQLLVYPAGQTNAPPTRTITKGLAGAAGVAVDASGDVYVANGADGNVLEYSSGAASLLHTYSAGLTYPVGVTVSGNTLYVTDRGNAANGNTQQVIEYALGNTNPTQGIGGPGFAPQLNEAIAVNPLGYSGTFYAAASTISIPWTGSCPVNGSYLVAEEHSSILWQTLTLSANEQVSGLAFDSSGNLYAADPCANRVDVYSNVNNVWTYAHYLQGTFAAPFLLTINNQILAIPNSGNGSSSGYVTIIDLTGQNQTATITQNLTHPVGAAVGP